MNESRTIVLPGDCLDESGNLKPGPNTYASQGRIYASRLGMKEVRGDVVGVIGLAGQYEPQRGDLIIATVIEMGPSHWVLDLNAMSPTGMHVNDVPWRVEFGETARYMVVGDTVLVKVSHVDEIRKVQVTMKDRSCRKLTGGFSINISPSRVARVIGRGGSMTNLIKSATGCRMFVGQNGVIWLDGEPEDVAVAIGAIRKIEQEAHMSGLTDRIEEWLKTHARGGRGKGPARAEDETPSYTMRDERDRGDRRQEE